MRYCISVCLLLVLTTNCTVIVIISYEATWYKYCREYWSACHVNLSLLDVRNTGRRATYT